MISMSCPPGLTNSGVESIFGSYGALIKATTDYWTSALVRHSDGADISRDLLTWRRTVTRRDRPAWASPYQVMAVWPLARLLDFSEPNDSEPNDSEPNDSEPNDSGPNDSGPNDSGPNNSGLRLSGLGTPGADASEQIPTLILPPQAGHDSCIVDYAPGQSQVATAKRSGLLRVFTLDWTGATQATKNATVEDYVALLADAVDRLGGRVHLVGDCQGGWLATIYAALFPQSVQSLTIAGAPIDFHAGQPLIYDWMKVLSPRRDLAFYRTLVAANGGVLPGEYLLAGFIAMQPSAEIGRQLQLLVHIRESEHVDRYRTFETWFKHTQPVPGAFYLWIVEHLFQNNELIKGTLRVGDRVVDLGEIRCPVHLLAGTTDHITPAPQVFALADYAGTDPAEISSGLVPGGHLGLFMGHESLDEHWAPLFASIASTSPALELAAS